MRNLPFIVAEVKVIETIRCEEEREDIKKGQTVTISNLNHPTDVKLWNRGQYQISPEYFDIENPVKIIRK